MSERKVLNKYYPPDYDPSKIPKGKRNKNATFNIRIMAPFNMRCNMCKEYIYKGKKFNSRKEDVMDETYLGLKIFRFYIKCPGCTSEIAFKTDLENTDYTLEAGAKRLFEAEKIAQQMAEDEKKAKEESELNPMTLLENRTKASRQEMDQIDTLEELRELNTRKILVNTDEMIEKYRKYEEMLQKLQMEQEEEEIKNIFGSKSTLMVKRLHEPDSDDDVSPKKRPTTTVNVTQSTVILGQNVSQETAHIKSSNVWQKSRGSLSTLKGLVKKKAPASLPAVISLVKMDSKETERKEQVVTATNNLYSCDTMEPSSSLCIHNTETTVPSSNSVIDNSNYNTTKAAGNSVGMESKSGHGCSALALLGTYSDSENDTSD